MNKKAIVINSYDNCVVAISDLKKNEIIFDINVLCDIPSGHKMCIKFIPKGSYIIKYGYPIGHATCDIFPGEHIHVHNIKTNLSGILTYEYNSPSEIENVYESKKFMGYKRSEKKVGIRNEIWIINTVGCVNKIANRLVKICENRYNHQNIDGVFTFEHPFGCSQLGEDHKITQLILKNMVNHPNVGGILVLSLGCENNNLKEFKKILGHTDDNRVKFLVTQDVEDEIKSGIQLIDDLVAYAKNFEREPVCLSNLTIGLKCGGSDGFSGITANPLVGSFSDKFIKYGGSTILTEVPEMFGAEKILMNRCCNKQTFDKLESLINNFKKYFIRYDQEIYENPSPGNKDGGISTLEDKSLGCTQKAGNSIISDVLSYGDTISKNGLHILDGPGNDLVAMTNLMAAHAHIILFTTGRGTPVGSAIPTIKISSNNNLYKNKPNWIDFDASILLNSKSSYEEATNSLFEYVIDVAEGKQTKNELNNYREISIFKDGVTL